MEFSKDQIMRPTQKIISDVQNKQQICEMQEYDDVKNDLIRILQKKVDKENYKSTIKQCKHAANQAHTEQCVGDSFSSMLKGLKKVKR